MRGSMRGPTVESVMTTEVVTAAPDTPFKEIVRLLDEHRIGALPVVDTRGVPVGVVSEADLVAKEEYAGGTEEPGLFAGSARRQRWHKAHARTAGDLMTRPAVTIAAGASVAAAARLLADSKVRRLFVVARDGTLVGVVSRRDLLSLFLRTDEQIRDDIAREVLARTLWADPNSITIEVADGVVTLAGRFDRRSEAEIATKLTAARPGVVGVVDHLSYEWDDITATHTAGL